MNRTENARKFLDTFEISRNSIEESKKRISEFKEFFDVVKGLEKNIVSQYIIPKMDEYMSSFENDNEKFSKMISSLEEICCTKKGKCNTYDIIRDDGQIEIGLLAQNGETLKSIYRQTGVNIFIIREINEFGLIIQDNTDNIMRPPQFTFDQGKLPLSRNDLFNWKSRDDDMVKPETCEYEPSEENGKNDVSSTEVQEDSIDLITEKFTEAINSANVNENTPVEKIPFEQELDKMIDEWKNTFKKPRKTNSKNKKTTTKRGKKKSK